MRIRFRESDLVHFQKGVYQDPTLPCLRFVVNKDGCRFFVYRKCIKGQKREIRFKVRTPFIEVRRQVYLWNSMTEDELKKELGFDEIIIGRKKIASVGRIKFKDVIYEFLDFKAESGAWTSYKTQSENLYRINSFAMPVVGNRLLKDITRSDIADVYKKADGVKKTKLRLIGTIKDFFNWSKSKGFYQGENPADLESGLKYLLPRTKDAVRNRGMLPLNRIQEFVQTLLLLKTVGARCFLLGILTATRSETIRKASWEDMDLKRGIWNVPREDLKIEENGDLAIPLCPKVIEFLKSMGPQKKGLIFPSRSGAEMSDNVFMKIVMDLNEILVHPFIDEDQSKRLGKTVRVTFRGMRACFKTWAHNDENGNEGKYNDKVSEIALHHKISDQYGNGFAYERNKYWLNLASSVFLLDCVEFSMLVFLL